MKKILLTLLIVCGLAIVGYAQEEDVYYFEERASELAEVEVDEAIVKKHFLGEDIANKMQILKDTYTWKEYAGELQTTDKTIVEKPAIYYSIKKLSSYYKKAIKKGMVDREEATKRLSNFIDIVYYIRYQETEAFENTLGRLKKVEDIEALFNKVVLR